MMGGLRSKPGGAGLSFWANTELEEQERPVSKARKAKSRGRVARAQNLSCQLRVLETQATSSRGERSITESHGEPESASSFCLTINEWAVGRDKCLAGSV